MWIKFNRFLNRYSDYGMWISLICILFFYVVKIPVLLIIATFFTGIPILIRAINGLKYKTVGIELLVSIAVIGAFIIGEFSEAAIVTFLFQFGTFLESKTMRKTRSSIKALTDMAPLTALRLENDTFVEVDVDEVEEEDILLCKTGSKVPVDGIIIEGEGYFIESSITGESVPKKKNIGDMVYAGTILDSGMVRLEATKVGEDTTFSKIIELVEEAQDAKSPVERFIDKFATYYTPAVVIVAALVFAFTRNLDTAITVLVLACPGALVIGAPIANVAGIGRGAMDGVILKGGDSMHAFAKTDVVVFDKTGTLTVGYPTVVECVRAEKIEESEFKRVLSYVAALEKNSEHPLARAIVSYSGESNTSITDIDVIKGRGITGLVNGKLLVIGSESFVKMKGISISKKLQEEVKRIKESAASVVIAGYGCDAYFVFGIKDTERADAAESIRKIKALGVKETVMLTGDNEITAKKVAQKLGIDQVYAQLLPQDKLEKIKQLMDNGRNVTFVGDGVNDSPSITIATTGIAMGSGTDVAIECSDVVLIKSELSSMYAALKLAKKTVRIMYENIFIAVGTVILLLIGLIAGYIHMSIGMFIHEASILLVIFNAMRLLYVKK